MKIEMKIEDYLSPVRELFSGNIVLPHQVNYIQTFNLFGEEVPTIGTSVLPRINAKSDQMPFLEKYPTVLHFLSLARIMESDLKKIDVLASLDAESRVFFTLVPTLDEMAHLGAVRGRFRLTPQIHESEIGGSIVAVSLFDRNEDKAYLPSDSGSNGTFIQALEACGRRRAPDLVRELCSATLNPYIVKIGAEKLPTDHPVQSANGSPLS